MAEAAKARSVPPPQFLHSSTYWTRVGSSGLNEM